MNFLLRTWRKIGTRLYLSLAFAVMLTMTSSALGIYYFEQSGDATHEARTRYVPAGIAAHKALREGAILRALQADARRGTLQPDSTAASLQRMDDSLGQATTVPELTKAAQQAQERAYQTANSLEQLNATAAAIEDYRHQKTAIALEAEALGPEAELAINGVLTAADEGQMRKRWEAIAQVATLNQPTVDTATKAFQAQGAVLELTPRIDQADAAATRGSASLDQSLLGLRQEAENRMNKGLQAPVSLFDQGRALLAAITVMSVTLACLAAWLLVGNGLVRPLERLSDRMRDMAAGDNETPVPGVGRDEVGQLAGALEHFRTQAIEVERLNLVEKLYGELREANEELTRMQDRLVAQEKLAALGELVSGVAHEISNPLNFVQNFSEVTMEMYSELAEVLSQYEETMTEEHRQTLEDIKEDMLDSLTRIQNNGGRALAIVERMRALGVTGGDPVEADVNHLVRSAVEVATTAFLSQNAELQLETVLDLQDDTGAAAVVEHDFGEALINLISNACQAMLERTNEQPAGYHPVLTVSTTRHQGETAVRVHDNGTGISQEALPQIFNPFYSTHEGILGAGLGLTIADVARRLGGNITVETEEGSHSAFTITLPATAQNSPNTYATAEYAAAAEPA